VPAQLEGTWRDLPCVLLTEPPLGRPLPR